MHEDGRDDLLRFAQHLRDIFDSRDVDLRNADHDPTIRQLRERRRGMASADVRDFAQRVEL